MSLLKNPALQDAALHPLEKLAAVSPAASQIPNHYEMYTKMERPMLPNTNLAKEMMSNDLYRIQPKDVFGKHEYALQ